MTNTQLIVQLITTIVPTLGMLIYLLLHRRQYIHAELDELRMRQECRLQHHTLDTRQTEAFTGLAHTFAPMLGQALERIVAAKTKREPPSLDDFGDKELFDEIDRRVGREYCRTAGFPVADACCPAEGETPHWEPPQPESEEPSTN